MESRILWALYDFSNGEAYIDLGQMDAIKDGIVTCTAVEDRSDEAFFLGELFMMTYQSESFMDFVAADTDKSAENVKDSSLTRSVIDISLNRDFVGAALTMYKDALMEYPEVSYLVFENNEGEEARFTVSLTIKTNVVYDEKEVIQDSTFYIWKHSFDASGNPIEGSDVFYTSDPSYPAD